MNKPLTSTKEKKEPIFEFVINYSHSHFDYQHGKIKVYATNFDEAVNKAKSALPRAEIKSSYHYWLFGLNSVSEVLNPLKG